MAGLRRKRAHAIVGEGLMFMRLTSWANWLYWLADAWVVGLLLPRGFLARQFTAGAERAYLSTTLPPPVDKFVRGTGEPVRGAG
jgi:hypothetical protein